ncbi:MAG: glycosyltransferase family 2 protein [Cyclobacteriaceae bacterium]
MILVIVVLYILSLTLILAFSLGQLNLALHYRKRVSNVEPTIIKWPYVTVQLPIYNEKYVVERLIDSIAALDYPKDKLEVQVLDDSNDSTSDLVKSKVQEYKAKGLNIAHIQRPDRKGFKAGALAYGNGIASGDFISVFDADFTPGAQFLRKTIPQFQDEKIGMVQTRWGHLNKGYSILTEMQAFGLDAHFTVEQSGRNAAGSFISFNGTAGVWRKSCIDDAGGWSADTLTEDLDLSYRAQLRGWKFKYLEDVISPAELPVILPAIKSQQYRWNKGAAETARKNLSHVLRSSLSFRQKIHASFHLLNSSVFILLLIAGILSIPMLIIKESNPQLQLLFDLGSVFLLGFIAIAYFYWLASKKIQPTKTLKYYLLKFPMFLSFSMGLSLHNTIAVIEGLSGIKTPFIRTPKFNVKSPGDSWKENRYINFKMSPSVVFELILALYFAFGVSVGIYLNDYGLILFHFMLMTGFGAVSLLSFKPITYGRR